MRYHFKTRWTEQTSRAYANAQDTNDVLRNTGADSLRRGTDKNAERIAGETGAGGVCRNSQPHWRQHAITAEQLQHKVFDPISFVIPDLIPAEGVTLLCAKPKAGKSWLALDLGVAATADRFVLGQIKPLQGDVLYLALEDSERRLQRRIAKLLPTFNRAWPSRLTLVRGWRRVNERYQTMVWLNCDASARCR
jgi:hypothetical protein